MAKKLIELKNISKSYDSVKVVDNMNLYVREKEFVTFLGPSGCGKTTTLRMIGGFEKADEGEIIFNGVQVNNIPPYQRPINTVFQRYALFPHLTVFGNVAFGLKNYNRTYQEIKYDVRRQHEAERKALQQALNKKDVSKEEKKELKIKLAELKKQINEEIYERKETLVEKKLNDIEEKYEKIIPALEKPQSFVLKKSNH